MASQPRHECHPPAPPEIIAGTLGSMAAEQTGRINRSIDIFLTNPPKARLYDSENFRQIVNFRNFGIRFVIKSLIFNILTLDQ